MRRNYVEGKPGGTIKQRIWMTVSNTSDKPREVWFEERVRSHRAVTNASPGLASTSGVLLVHGEHAAVGQAQLRLSLCGASRNN